MLEKSVNHNQRGIGLLELMLSLSIIAILLVMATRYFLQANEQQKINNAISQFNGIAGAEACYFQSSSPPKYVTDFSTLISANCLPAGIGGSTGEGIGVNPWGGNIKISSTAPLTIVMSSVPQGNGDPDTCKKLANTINNTMSGSNGSGKNAKGNATCDDAGITVIFH
jgi:type II secretory pathway pseudopilin PulG